MRKASIKEAKGRLNKRDVRAIVNYKFRKRCKSNSQSQVRKESSKEANVGYG